VRLLLDTHVAIWAVTASDRLPDRVSTLILDADERFVSYCSLWEIGVKSAPGRKTKAPLTVNEAIFEFDRAGFQMLEIKLAHILTVADLPRSHGDPFDRLILAQAISEPLRLVTKDRQLAAYSDMIVSW
jgi:PIN domain nuclease of toxin-antitoxin system